ncbi:protein of unknown function [Ekhidna lutea]|uniref:PKD domain-containing protein n=1 Tax=Ekhidna lutea TaxID=447679 RepID=A0A239EZJ2_EKHLU|nr:DUF4331 family protein [Ekhidna lutea]SNS50086.1 protein of unknown function [Ekhidna lutea]
MKNIFKIFTLFLAGSILLSSCGDDDSAPIEDLQANLGAAATVDVESTVSLDASASVGTIATFDWMVTDPDGAEVTLENESSAMPSFVATKAGDYSIDLTVTSATGLESMVSGSVTVESPTYATSDQMGRPAINTVFNFFGSAEVKNGYNMTLPSEGSANADAFAGILNALQTYIYLDPAQFENILGIGNDALAGVLAVDVLQSNKNSATAYGSLNGRALGDDVVDVTLILAFDDQSAAGADNQVKAGLVSDNVQSNDKSFSNSFPYLADPH